MCIKDWENKSYVYLNKAIAVQTNNATSFGACQQDSEAEDLICEDFSDEKYSLTAMNMERFLFPMQQCERKQIICHSC